MPYFVTEYHVRFSDDGNSWSYYNDPLGMPEIFMGNENADTVKYNNFTHAIVAKYLQINPIRWTGYIALRMEVFGCDYGNSLCVHHDLFILKFTF